MNRIQISAIALSVSLSVVTLADAQTQKLRIGALISLDGGGAALGANAQIGINMAVAEINAAGGMMGRQVEVVYADDRSDPAIASVEARRLAQREKVELVVGPVLSANTLAALPVFTEAKIASISSVGVPQFTPEFAPFGFSNFYLASVQGVAMANYVANVRKAKSAAILADNTPNPKAVVEAARSTLTKLGIAVTGVQEYQFKSTDMTPQLLALRRGNPEVLILHGVGAEDLGNAMKNLQEIGWNVPVAGSASFSVFSSVIARIAGPEAFKNTWGLELKAVTYCAGDPLGQSEYSKFLVKLKAAAPGQFAKLTPSSAANFYDSVYLLKAAVDATKSTDAAKIAGWLETNARTAKGIYAPFVGSKTNHFLVDPESLVPVDGLGRVREDGLAKRAGC